MDVLCSLVQQDLAEVEKEDREMAARAKALPMPSASTPQGAQFGRSGAFSQIDHSQYAQQQLASISSHMSDKTPSGAAPSLAEMAYSSSPAHPLRHQVFLNQARPQQPMMGNQLTRQHSAQPSWQAQDSGLRWQQTSIRRTSSAPNEGPRQPLYPGVPSRADMEKKPDVVMEKLETAPRRSIKKAAGTQKAKKVRSPSLRPLSLFCPPLFSCESVGLVLSYRSSPHLFISSVLSVPR